MSKYQSEPPSDYIEAYHEIMKKYQQRVFGEMQSPHAACVNPDCNSRKGGSGENYVSPEFYVESGYYFCEQCDSCNGKALGYFDYKERDRFSYRKKSIYQRKYHYENTVKDIGKRLSLSDDEQYLLLTKLKDINEDIIREINSQFKRKRIEEMGCQKYQQLGLKLSKETFQNYENWWKMYQSKKVTTDLGNELSFIYN